MRIHSDTGWHRLMILTDVTSGDLRGSGTTQDYVFWNTDRSGNPMGLQESERVSESNESIDTPYGDWVYFGFAADSNGYDCVIYNRTEQLDHISGDTGNPPDAPYLTYLNYGNSGEYGDVDLAEAGYNTKERLSVGNLQNIWEETKW